LPSPQNQLRNHFLQDIIPEVVSAVELGGGRGVLFPLPYQLFFLHKIRGEGPSGTLP